MFSSLVIVLVMSQTFPRPYPLGLEVTPTLTLATGKTSESCKTGILPFSMQFHCTYDHTYENGCWAKAVVNLNEILNGSQYRRGCLLPSSSFVPDDVQSVEADLSGVQVWLTPQSSHMPFKELTFDTQTVDLNSNQVAWYVHVNWRDQAGTMIDGFDVKVGGELVWSTGEVSDVRRKTFSCVGESDSCSSSTSFKTPFNYVGSAFSRMYLSVPQGTIIRGLASSISETLSSPTDVTLDVSCAIGSARQTECEHSVAVLSGEPSEVTPFTSANFSGSDNQPIFFSNWQNYSTLSPHREMRCGLKHFVASVFNAPDNFGSLRVGAGPGDCGFNGPLRPVPPLYTPAPPTTWSYSVTDGFHGFLIADPVSPPSQTYQSVFRLDGAKLVWP